MKSEKGLTLLSTIFLVIIIAIIAFGIVYIARMEVDKEKTEDIKTNMLLVQAKIKTISGKYILEKKEDVLVGTKLSEMKEEEHIKEFLEKELFDQNEKNKKYYVINQENLNELELEKVTLEEGGYYIVEYTTSEVYFTKGYQDEDGNIHYKASEAEASKEEKVEEDNQKENNKNTQVNNESTKSKQENKEKTDNKESAKNKNEQKNEKKVNKENI